MDHHSAIYDPESSISQYPISKEGGYDSIHADVAQFTVLDDKPKSNYAKSRKASRDKKENKHK